MKRFVIGLTFLLAAATSVFAQSNDFQTLAVVKYNKSESILLKDLKARDSYVQKVYKQSLPVEMREELLNNMIHEKLLVQAATKEGITVTDSEVDSSFLNMFAQGAQITEAQIDEMVKQQYGISLEEYVKMSSGMTIAQFKAYLKTQLISQKYVMAKKGNELRAISASDDEIRKFYEMNKKQFVWDDMAKLFVVVIPKGNDAAKAQSKAVEMKNAYTKDKSVSKTYINSSENGVAYIAQEFIVAKTEQQAKQLGWSYDNIIELFGNKVGYISDIKETDQDFQFYVVLSKYDSKMLGISDIVQPDTNVTVYEYIKTNLTQQKQAQAFSQAAVDLANALDTPANVDRKKTGDELKALLTW